MHKELGVQGAGVCLDPGAAGCSVGLLSRGTSLGFIKAEQKQLKDAQSSHGADRLPWALRLLRALPLEKPVGTLAMQSRGLGRLADSGPPDTEEDAW